MASQPISPVQPSKKPPPPIQPNAHPYAVKTTTSALLSRSNSSSHYANHTRHHYIPGSAPPRATTGTRARHRHSSSLSAVEGAVHDVACTIPAPLPTPPPTVASPDNALYEPERTHRRADTMPSDATEPVTERQKRKYKQSEPELGPNPRQWNTDELITYLETSFNSGNDTIRTSKDDATPVDILEYVRTRGLTGRELLRLVDSDLSGTPLSDIQRTQLLERSRTLRTDILRGRIYVDSYHSYEVSDHSNDIYTHSARPSPFHSIHGASVSAEDLRLLSVDNHGEGASALPLSPVVTLHRSNSISDASAQRYRDLANMRMRRRGRVKGLVETWERACTNESESSASEEGSMSGSEAESESETDPRSESVLDTNRLKVSSSKLPSAEHDAPHNDIRSPTTDSMGQEASSLAPPPPYPHLCTAHEVVEEEEEEPSIEELLASNIPLKGARAWEADFGLGETVKGIPISAGADADADAENPPILPTETRTSRDLMDGPHQKGNSIQSKRLGVRGSGGKGKKAKTQKRIVTAIFTGSPTDEISANVGDEVHVVDHHRLADIAHVEAPSLDPQHDPDSLLRALEESIAATRAQMDVFRVRLEQVEADATQREAELKRAQYADAHHSSGCECRKQRSEAGVQTVELPGDAGAGDKDILQGWETMSLCDITRTIVAKTVRWLFSYGCLGVPKSDDHLEMNDKHSPPRRAGCLPLARISCSIFLASLAICAVVLRRMGFGKWVRKS